ncbi:SLATT domain-containing protein [Thalassotalea euphylliae]|uniref:SLATT domain-containing protein n=1 Tax=Thalassotalea euphylliae TaxID=1655234 RepID=UPI00364268BB
MSQEQEKHKLSTRIWRTKGARFNAYRRLSKKNSALTFITSFSSIHLLALGILQLSGIVSISPDQAKLLNFIGMTVSLIILAYSLIEGGKEYGLKSERHHLCGIELDNCYSQLQFKNEQSDIEALASRYNAITKKYLLNHDTIDDEYFRLQHQDDFACMKNSSWLNKAAVNFKYKHYDRFKAFIFASVPLSVSIYIIWF